MKVGEFEYFSIIDFKNISINNIKAHLKKFETIDFAYDCPGGDIVIVKESTGAKRDPSGFIFPHSYRYKVYDMDRKPFYLNFKNCKVTEYIFETLRSGYSSDSGNGTISVMDRCRIVGEKRIDADYNDDAVFITNILAFLIEFENEYNADWKNYNLNEELKELKKKLETQAAEAQNEITELKEKLKGEKSKKSKIQNTKMKNRA